MRWYHQPLDSRRKRHLLGTEYRRLNTVNGRGQPVQETYGNGMVLLPQYKAQTGQVTELKYMLGSGELRRLNYAYDVFGNLRRQTLNSGQTQEDLAYDSLQRLVSSIRSGAASGTTTYAYDVVGNFTSKSDFSTTASNAYTYTGGSCGGGPNAVKSIALAAGGTRTYCYDANGNLTSDNAGLSIRYDHMNMATQATRGSQTDTFRYGSDGKRTRSWGADGSRVYLPGYEHRTDTGETKVYVGDYAVITRTGTTRKVDYLLKDRLGSVDAVANAVGSITEARGYDPFGKPRDGTWADRTPATLTSRLTTPKGFTQHEHLDALELIHMNGRVFEYHMGRFTGVDPFIQFPLNSQSLNPYSYILNNPLSGTDPTGYRSVCPTGNCNAVYSFISKNEKDQFKFGEEKKKTTPTDQPETVKDSNGAQDLLTVNGGMRSQADSSPASDKGAPSTCPPPPPGQSKSEILRSQPNSYMALAIKQNRRVSEMISNLGETKEEFDARVAEELRRLRDADGSEYATTAWTTGDAESTRIGVVIQTSDSPFVAVNDPGMTMSTGDAWARAPMLDLHIHGKLSRWRSYSELDVAYLAAFGKNVRLNSRPQDVIEEDADLIDREAFSVLDKSYRYGGLVTTAGILRAERICGKWVHK